MKKAVIFLSLAILLIAVVGFASADFSDQRETREPVCGNNICEQGEANYVECICPPQQPGQPLCLAPCQVKQGTCSQDCERPQVKEECSSDEQCQDKFNSCYYACSDQGSCILFNTFAPLSPYPECETIECNKNSDCGRERIKYYCASEKERCSKIITPVCKGPGTETSQCAQEERPSDAPCIFCENRCEQGMCVVPEAQGDCGNGICDAKEVSYPTYNQFFNYCPQDCEWVCGNGICEEGESQLRTEEGIFPFPLKCSKDCKEEHQTVKAEIIRVREGDTESVPVSIKGSPNSSMTIGTKKSEAETSEKLVVQDSKLYMEVNDKKKSEIKVLPEEASSRAVQATGKTQVDKIELRQEKEKPLYSVKVVKRAKLFFVIPITLKIEIKVDAETGDVLSIKKPWWSFFVW